MEFLFLSSGFRFSCLLFSLLSSFSFGFCLGLTSLSSSTLASGFLSSASLFQSDCLFVCLNLTFSLLDVKNLLVRRRKRDQRSHGLGDLSRSGRADRKCAYSGEKFKFHIR